MATTVEDLVNQALIELGYPGRIGSIYEGSEASNAALEIYGQTRDELLDAGEWPLARRANVKLTLLKGPPPAGGYNPLTPWTAQYPPPGWLYQYAFPSDCLELHAILYPPGMMFDLDPKPAVWRIDNDNSKIDRDGVATTEKKVILTQVREALAVYTGQVTDPLLWEPGFTAVVIKKLAEKLARRLRAGEGVLRDVAASGAAVAGEAEAGRG